MENLEEKIELHTIQKEKFIIAFKNNEDKTIGFVKTIFKTKREAEAYLLCFKNERINEKINAEIISINEL